MGRNYMPHRKSPHITIPWSKAVLCSRALYNRSESDFCDLDIVLFDVLYYVIYRKTQDSPQNRAFPKITEMY